MTISLLVKYEDCSALDWLVGTHGILIDYRGFSATFLPEVASEQGWDQMETLCNLLRKGGYRGKVDADVVSQVKCTRYQSSKVTKDFAEYVSYMSK